MNIHLLCIDELAIPDAYVLWARERSYNVSQSLLPAGKLLAINMSTVDLVILLGKANLDSIEAVYDVASYHSCVAALMAAKKAIVGICTGAQFLGDSLGAPRVYNPGNEARINPINMTQAGKWRQNLAHFDDILRAKHYHAAKPGLTKGAIVLAANVDRTQHIIEYGEFAYGFHCELETDEEACAILHRSDLEESAAAHRYEQSVDAPCPEEFPARVSNDMVQFLDNLVTAYSLHKIRSM